MDSRPAGSAGQRLWIGSNFLDGPDTIVPAVLRPWPDVDHPVAALISCLVVLATTNQGVAQVAQPQPASRAAGDCPLVQSMDGSSST